MKAYHKIIYKGALVKFLSTTFIIVEFNLYRGF